MTVEALITPLPETPAVEPKQEKAVEVTGDGNSVVNVAGDLHWHLHASAHPRSRETPTLSKWRLRRVKEADLAACR